MKNLFEDLNLMEASDAKGYFEWVVKVPKGQLDKVKEVLGGNGITYNPFEDIVGDYGYFYFERLKDAKQASEIIKSSGLTVYSIEKDYDN